MTTRLPRGADLPGDAVARDHLVLLRQEFHREVDALQLAAGNGRSRGLVAPPRQDDRVELLAQIRRGDVDADVHARPERHPLGLHLLHAAVDEVLLHLEVGDAVAQQAADAVGALEERHQVAGARQLLRAGEAGRPGADDGDLLAGCAAAGPAAPTQPSFKAWSMICFSICLMVTGSSLMLRTQASSHGAGQTRPVNSGKLLVECSALDRRSASGRGRPGRSSRG